MVRKILSLAMVCLVCQAVEAVNSGVPVLSLPGNAQILTAGNAASQHGLAGASINPASLTAGKNENWQAQGSYHQLFESASLINAGFFHALPSLSGTLGAQISFLNYGSIDKVDATGKTDGTVSAGEMMAAVTYSRPLLENTHAGVSLKAVNADLAGKSAMGFAADAGVKQKLLLKGNELWLSGFARNLGPGIKFVSEATPLPSSAGGSASYSFRTFLPRQFDIRTGPQAEYFLDGLLEIGGGAEVEMFLGGASMIFRGRYLAGAREGNLAFGGGLTYRMNDVKMEISGGLASYSSLGNSMLFSASATRILAYSQPVKMQKVIEERPVVEEVKPGKPKKISIKGKKTK